MSFQYNIMLLYYSYGLFLFSQRKQVKLKYQKTDTLICLCYIIHNILLIWGIDII